jgi:hypothetical protein
MPSLPIAKSGRRLSVGDGGIQQKLAAKITLTYGGQAPSAATFRRWVWLSKNKHAQSLTSIANAALA